MSFPRAQFAGKKNKNRSGKSKKQQSQIEDGVDWSKISGEQMIDLDIGQQLESMIVEGSDFDKKLDAYIDKLEAQGLTEEDIMKKMMGGQLEGL